MDASDDEEWESLVQSPDSVSNAAAGSKAEDENNCHDAAATTPSASNNDIKNNSHDASASSQSQSNNLALALSSRRPSRNSNHERMLIVHEKLESRKRIKEKLVNHPIQLLWSRFIGYLLSELWQLDARIRLALGLILLGLLTKIMLVSTAFFWYPRVFLVPCLIIVPFLFLNPSYVPVTLERTIKKLQNPSSLVDSLSQVDPKLLRRLCCVSLFLPTLLEVRTIQFLSQIKIEAGWTIYNLIVAALIAGTMWTAHSRFGKSPRDCTHVGFVCLYGSALLVTLVQLDVWKMPILMAPFCLATGILLLHSVDDNYEWCTRAVHHALRLSLRDALTLVGESVSEDEMLQLAMLRWIVDYWGSTPAPMAGSTAEAASREQSRRPSTPVTTASSTHEASLVTVPHERELSWSELLPMLTMTSEQIRTEVDMLQSRNSSSSSRPDTSSQSTAQDSSTFAPSSVIDLQTMLASMDLDDRAKPAVMAYKQAVQSFPPSRETAILLSVARRCPALLALLWELIVSRSGTFSTSVILLPFIVVELVRCKKWSESCKRAATHNTLDDGDEALFLERVDPVVILLSGDQLSLHRPPTLLGVWMNVVSSVSALEMGLTAARCVQTTAVAIDFAQNIMSLAEFGFEVASRGWIHGASLLAKELVIHHTRSITITDSDRVPQAKYTSAALKAVANSQKMTRNVQELMEDENSRQVLNPVVGILSIAVGRGWLWGRDPSPPTPQSTVVIEELDADSEEIPSVFGQSLRSRLELEKQTVTAPKPDVSDIMDLIAAAASRHLISQDEKNGLCERLLKMQGDSTAFDAGWMEATKRTLEGLILIDDRAEDSVVAAQTGGTNETKSDIAGNGQGKEEEEGKAARKSSSHNESDVQHQQVTPISKPYVEEGHAKSSDGLKVNDATSEIEPRPTVGTLASNSAETGSAVSCETPELPPSDQPGDNIWMQIGGGLAVVGAVVGVAALALQNQNGDGRERRERHQQRGDNHTHPSQ